MRSEEFLGAIPAWAASRPDIRAVYLVGSYARGSARRDSDIDLVILTENPQAYLRDTGWVRQFGEAVQQQVEDWGRLKSLRVWYQDGPEVEFGLSAPDWMAEPMDEGTAQVIAGGMQVIYRKEGN